LYHVVSIPGLKYYALNIIEHLQHSFWSTHGIYLIPLAIRRLHNAPLCAIDLSKRDCYLLGKFHHTSDMRLKATPQNTIKIPQWLVQVWRKLTKKERLQKKSSCHSAGHGQYTIETFKVSTLRRHLHSAICHYHMMAWINVEFWQRDQMQPQSAGPGDSTDWDKTRQRESKNANIKNNATGCNIQKILMPFDASLSLSRNKSGRKITTQSNTLAPSISKKW
jgi:hypothetical protein